MSIDTHLSLRTMLGVALFGLVTLAPLNGPAIATIINPENPSTSPASSSVSTITDTPGATDAREILYRASFIAFTAATATQKAQTLSVDNATSELLKNYMASMLYIPKANALPSDADALDEPWTASTSDGMVVPSMDFDDDSDDLNVRKGLNIDLSKANPRNFLKLLQPVQNALVSSPFGIRWGRPHQGIDLAAPMGTPIVSAENGKVVYSGWKQGYGNFVAVDHGHGYETHYAHCSKVVVNVGQHVSKGQLIAKVGSTGHSTGPHLHFEVMANGIHRNPIKFLNQPLTVVQAH